MTAVKKIILWTLLVTGVLMIYFSAYLPYAKSRVYINAVRQAQNLRSVDEFKNLFNSVFNFYSPVGEEEVVKFLSNDIAALINRPEATEDVSGLLIEYLAPRFFSNNVRHMITGARIYETLWRRWGKEVYYSKSEDYYQKAYAIGPKLPPVLYGMLGIYYMRQDFNRAKSIAGQILTYWPNDERIKNIPWPQ